MEKPKFIKKQIFYDSRGSFSPLSLTVENKKWIQSNISVNPKKFTLRGLHFQKSIFDQAKLVKVITGKVLDFVVDLRPLSAYNGEITFFEMSEGDEVIVPRGFAHGFITLEENSIVQYLVDNEYQPNSEGVKVWTNYPEILEKIISLDNEFDVSKITIAEKDLIEK